MTLITLIILFFIISLSLTLSTSSKATSIETSSSSSSSSSKAKATATTTTASTSTTTTTTTTTKSEKITFSIPYNLSINEFKRYKKIKITSSHGRNNDNNSINSSSTTSSSSSSSIIKYKTFKVILRAIYLFLLFFPILLTSGFAFISSMFRNLVWFSLLHKSIAYSGAAFIKWGQWASTRPDMFPISLCNVLENLQSNSPEHSYLFTKSQIELELNAPIEQIFEKFHKKPIASGSIAQVYKAVLNGKVVAVKVRHPNVGEQIELDFIIMKAIAEIIDSIPGLQWIHLKDSMAQFSDTISSQIRLDIEGRHLYQFNKNFNRWRDTKFPEPIIMTQSILVESFEEGQSVKTYSDIFASELVQANIIKGKETPIFDKTLAHFIVTRGEDIYLKMLLKDNLMHADLHPGNIIIRVSNDKKGKKSYKIVLVDAGMVAELLPDEQRNFIGLIEAIGDGDGKEAAEYLLQFSETRYSEENRKAFIKDIIDMFHVEAKGYGNNVSIGKVLRGILNLVRIHKVRIDANYATLVMNCLCLDGLAQSLLPQYNILDNAKPLLRLNRLSKKVLKNRNLSSFISKLLLPIAEWIKSRGDKKFLQTSLKL